MRRRLGLAGGIAAIAVCLLAAPAQATVKPIVSCPDGHSSGDGIDHGFYVQGFQGYTLGSVTLRLIRSGAPAGAYDVTLTARSGAYDGPLIGTATTSFMPDVAPNYTAVTFDFNTPVAFGSTITFALAHAGAGILYYDTSVGCNAIVQTNQVSPPLDSDRGNSVSAIITGDDSPPIFPSPLPQVAPLTGARAAALKKCKKKKGHKAKRKCKKKAKKLPV